MRPLATICLALACAAAAACQETPPVPAKPAPGQPAPAKPDPAQPDPAQALLAEMVAKFQKEGVVVDPAAKTVAVAAAVNQPQDPIEYLLVHRRGKRHEAMFHTPTKASVLNGALLLLGLMPGKNATVVEKQPPPTLEEIEKGVDPLVVTPPQGTTFWMTVRWTTPEGQAVEYCVEDLLLDLSTQQPIADCSWVYLGGRMAKIYKNEPEVFVADFEGNFISTCYLMPENHLGTLSHASARDDQNWWLTDKVPPPETAVTFVFHRDEPALHKARRERLAKQKAAKEAKEAKEAKDAPPAKDDGQGRK